MSDKWPCEKHILCTKARPCGDCRETKLEAEIERLKARVERLKYLIDALWTGQGPECDFDGLTKEIHEVLNDGLPEDEEA